MEFAAALRRVRDTAPLVQCITNFVTVNDCANIILAAGGSPSMADDIREAAESAAGADALVCNLGAIGKVDSMISAGQSANRAGHPVVLDPVAAGGTALRRQESARLLNMFTSPPSGATPRRSGPWPCGSRWAAAWTWDRGTWCPPTPSPAQWRPPGFSPGRPAPWQRYPVPWTW